MKILATTLCILGSAVALSACAGDTDHSGASYAKSRTAGDVEYQQPAPAERVFREVQSK